MKKFDIEVGGDSLKIIQDVLFKNLVILSKELEKEGITYWLDFGTLLGAVRQHDIISWDDDIDISILEVDKFRLLKLVESKFQNQFEIFTAEDSPGLVTPIKLTLKGTRVRERAFFERGINSQNFGLSIDIFTLADTKFFELKKINSISFLISEKKWISTNMHLIHAKKFLTLKKLLLWTLVKLIPRNIVLKLYLYAKSKTYSYENSSDILRYTSNSPFYREVFNKNQLLPTQQVILRGHLFPVPNNSDLVLTVHYGSDYLTPTDSFLRKTHALELTINEDSPFYEYF